MFKKLFTIKYHEKEFVILLASDGRKTFLEVKHGHLEFPEYHDFCYLHNIFNNPSEYLPTIKKLTFKEKVRLKSALLLLTTIPYSYIAHSNINLFGKFEEKLSPYQQIEIITDLDAFYESVTITREDCIEAINNNDSIAPEYKEIAIMALDNNLKIAPNINLRVFYENVVDLKIISVDSHSLKNKINLYAAACYNPGENTIYLSDSISKFTIIHEFNHIFCHLIDDDKRICVHGSTLGRSLEEAMTDKITASIIDRSEVPYSNEYRLLNFYMKCLPGYDYDAYYKEGISGLITMLKESFPGVDIDYLINFSDAMTNAELKMSEFIRLYEQNEFLDELFKICLRSIKKDNLFESFNNFMDLISYNDTSYLKYFDEYIDYLLQEKYISKDIHQLYKNTNYLAIDDGEFYLSGSKDTIMTYDKTILNSNPNSLYIGIPSTIRISLCNNLLKQNYSNDYMKDFFLGFCDTSFFISELNKNKDGIRLINNELIKRYNRELSNLNTDEIVTKYQEYSFICDHIGINNYQLKESFYNLLIDKGYLSKKDFDNIFDYQGYFVYKKNIYKLKSIIIDNTPVIDLYKFFGENFRGYSLFSFNKDLTYQVFIGDELKDMKINNDGLIIPISNKQKEKLLIEKLKDNSIDVTNPEYLKKSYEEFTTITEEKYPNLSLTSKDGQKLYSDNNIDNLLVTLGNDTASNIKITLYDMDKVVYSNSDLEYQGNTETIRFKDYLFMLNDREQLTMESLIDENYLKSIPTILLKYYCPGLTIDNNHLDITNDLYLIIDGNKVNAGKVFIYEDNNYNVIITYPGGRSSIILNTIEEGIESTNFLGYLTMFDIDPNKTYSHSEISTIIKEYFVNNKSHNLKK